MIKKFIGKIKEMGFKNILMMHLGLICCAIATVLFVTPARLVVSGSTGLSVLLGIIFNMEENYYVFMYAINFILLILSYFTLGKEFTFKTVYGSLMLPTLGMLVTEVIHLIAGPDFIIAELIAGVEPIFVVLFASILMGFGIGVNMKVGGSTGGADIMSMYYSIKKQGTLGSFTTIINSAIIVFSRIVLNSISFCFISFNSI